MATETIRTCDRCKKSIIDKEQLWKLEIGYGCTGTAYPYAQPALSTYKTAEWCRPCMLQNGILGPRDDVPKSEMKEDLTSFEELFKAIVRKVVQEYSPEPCWAEG